jgi:Uma2 family endonuclease
MTGGGFAHAVIQANLILAVGGRLRGSPCRVIGSHLKLRVDGSIRYPDAMVISRAVGARKPVVADPVVVFEVLSPSTARTDRFVKHREYLNALSIQRYDILEHDGGAASVFERAGDRWISGIATEGESLAIPEFGIEVPLAELYDGIVFEQDETA